MNTVRVLAVHDDNVMADRRIEVSGVPTELRGITRSDALTFANVLKDRRPEFWQLDELGVAENHDVAAARDDRVRDLREEALVCSAKPRSDQPPNVGVGGTRVAGIWRSNRVK